MNGLRSTFNNYLIDGVDNNAYGTSNQGFSNQVMQPAPDAVAEFKVVTNNMSAEYGRSAGATINVAYASGANRLRGSGWEYARRTDLNATGFFKPATGVKPQFDRDQFGAVLGGPIVKNKAFFFADLEMFRQTRGQTASSSIPTVAQRGGVLSVDVRNPLTGVVYPAGTPIPMTAFARQVLNDLPAPTNGGTANNLQVLQEFTNDTDKAGGKVDIQFNPRLSAFGRVGWRDANIFDQPTIAGPSGGGGNAETYVTNKQFSGGLTYTPNGTSLLEVRMGWSRTVAGKNPYALFDGQAPADQTYGITGLPSDPRVAAGLPPQLITGYSDLGRQATNPQWQYPEVWNPKVNYSWLSGRHSLKTGYEYQKVYTEVQDVNPLYGRNQYAGQFTRPTRRGRQQPLQPGRLHVRPAIDLRAQQSPGRQPGPGHALPLRAGRLARERSADAQSGPPLRVRDAVGRREQHPVELRSGDAVDGDCARWLGRGAVHHQARSQQLRSARRLCLQRHPDDRRARRLRRQLRALPSGRRSKRAAHQRPAGHQRGGRADAGQADFRTTEQGYPQGLTDPAQFNPLAANITYMPNDYHSSQVQSWFASVQQELWPGALIDLAYVGNRADDLLLLANYNQAAPNNSAGTLTLQQRRPIQEYADITYAFNGGKSRYHAFQTKFDWRFGAGTSLLSSLTLSQTKDNGAGSLENPNGNFPAPQDINNLEADFGLSGYHQPYNSTTSFVMDLPFGRGHRYLSDASTLTETLLGGWQIAGINSLYAGEMVTLVYTPSAAAQVSGIQQDFRGANNYRPNVNGDVLVNDDQRGPNNYLNPASVTIPADISQPFGNAPRNSVRGPMIWQVDMVASKRFPMPWPAGSSNSARSSSTC